MALREAYIKNVVDETDVSFKRVLSTCTVKNLWRSMLFDPTKNMPTFLFQTIVKGLLGLIEDLEKLGITHAGLLKDHNIGYESGVYDKPKILNWNKGVVTDDAAIYYTEFKALLDSMTANVNCGELDHFSEILDKIILSPGEKMNKSLLRKHILLFSMEERIQFVKTLKSNWNIVDMTRCSLTFDFRKASILTTKSFTKAFAHLYGVLNFHYQTNYALGSLEDLLRFMRNTYEHPGTCTDAELTDALDIVAPSILLYLCRYLYKMGTLGSVL